MRIKTAIEQLRQFIQEHPDHEDGELLIKSPSGGQHQEIELAFSSEDSVLLIMSPEE